MHIFYLINITATSVHLQFVYQDCNIPLDLKRAWDLGIQSFQI